MFYWGWSDPGRQSKLGLAVSDDLLNWRSSACSSNPPAICGTPSYHSTMGPQASATLFEDGVYKTWFSGKSDAPARTGHTSPPPRRPTWHCAWPNSRDGNGYTPPGMRIDLHTHTSPASSCSRITHDEYVAFCRDHGVSAIALTNHGDVSDNLVLETQLADVGTLLLHGVEVSTVFGDFVVFSPDLEYLATLRPLQEPLTANGVPADAAVVWVHPMAGSGKSGSTFFPRLEKRVAPFIHAVELYNGNWLGRPYVEGAAAIAASLHLPSTGGSDAHNASRLGACCTEVDEPVTSTADLVRVLRAGAVRPWRRPQTRGLRRSG